MLQVITSSGGKETKQSKHALSYHIVCWIRLSKICHKFLATDTHLCVCRDFPQILFALGMYIYVLSSLQTSYCSKIHTWV